jgi:sigma-B regulation protein RsbU (phosphoserine phosphatase)
MMTPASAVHMTTTLHRPQTTAGLLQALHDTLLGHGIPGSYTLLFAEPQDQQAVVYTSTLPEVLPGTTLAIVAESLGTVLRQAELMCFAEPQPITCGDIMLHGTVLAPLHTAERVYGVLVLHEVVPEACAHDTVACIVSQFGLALARVQLIETLQQQHAVDTAKLRAIAETREVLCALELDVVLTKLMELALMTVGAEVGCIVLRESEQSELVCHVSWGLDEEGLTTLRLPDGTCLVETVIRDNIMCILHRADIEKRLQPDPILDGIDNLVMLPLGSRQHGLGCLTAVNLTVTGEADLELLRTATELASTAIENALLHQRVLEQEVLREQLRIAGDIQRGLLPTELPTMAGIQLAARNLPCDDSGGDYYDWWYLDADRVGFVVGDATGHGIGAAMIATTVRALLRALVQSSDTRQSATLFEQLNDLAEADFTQGRFITLFFGVYDRRNRTVTYVSAGHAPPALLYRQDEGRIEMLEATGMPLGIFTGTRYEQNTTRPLAAGDFVLVLTDGVHEAEAVTEEFFGEERFVELVHEHRQEPPDVLIERVCQAVHDFRGAQPQKDDITLLCLRVVD